MQPDEYEVKWARARMWRTKAPNNFEARERLRDSGNPLDQKALEILKANDAAREAARAAAVRSMGVEEAERARQAGATEPLLAGDTEPGRVSPADRAILERARESSADCRAAAEPGSLEAGGYGDD